MTRGKSNGFGTRTAIVVGMYLVALTPIATAAPAANVSRTSIGFGNVAPQDRIVQPVFVTNTGDAPLSITSLTLGGATPADFLIQGTCAVPMTLPAGNGRCRIDVVSNLSFSGPANRSATLTIASNSSDAAPVVNISGLADPGASSLVSPQWVDFSTHAVGTSAPPQVMTFTNPFTSTLTFDAPLFVRGETSDFAATTTCLRLVGGATCTITLGFVPAAAGPRSAELEIDFRASDSPTQVRVHRYSVTGVGASTDAPAVVNIDQQGLTGSWYEAATSGQGLEIEVFKDLVGAGVGYMQGSWFTFDAAASGGADHNRWYTFGGNVLAGANSATLPLFRNVGGNFNALPVTTGAQVGQVTMTFSDCTTAQFDYAFADGSNRSGSVPMTRLTPNVLCAAADSTTGASDFGLSGNWFDAARSGQGVLFEVNPVAKYAFLAWYTYAIGGQSQGVAGQRWYTAQATYTPGARSIPLLVYETTGGVLDSATPTPTSAQVGSATLTFSSCSAARLAYSFTGGSNIGQSGAIDLTRVGPVPASCAF